MTVTGPAVRTVALAVATVVMVVGARRVPERGTLPCALVGAALMGILVWSGTAPVPFIYFQF